MFSETDIFSAALGNETYLLKIIKTPEKQNDFINLLEQKTFSPAKIITLITQITNSTVRNLLIIHLLSRNDYLHRLTEKTFLDLFDCKKSHLKASRLNPFLAYLDISKLPDFLITKITPEAAVSILCYVPFFHLLTEAHIKQLIPKSFSRSFTDFWINNYASLPNAHYILAHLLKILSIDIWHAIKNLDSAPQKTILLSMIEHLNLYENDIEQLLNLSKEESYLLFAMNLCLKKNVQPVYFKYIKQLAAHLLSQQSLSTETIRILIPLNCFSEFDELRAGCASQIKDLVKEQAKQGDLSIFYHNGTFQGAAIYQRIMYLVEPDTIQSTHETSIIHKKSSITLLEFFLEYLNCTPDITKKIVQDYIVYERNHHPKNNKRLHLISDLLTQRHIKKPIKDVIFEELLAKSDYLDEHVCAQILVYGGVTTLNYCYHHNQSFENMINLCKKGLTVISAPKHDPSIQLIQQHMLDVSFEQHLETYNTTFYKIVAWGLRGIRYGWDHFFRPLKPRFKDDYSVESPSRSHLLSLPANENIDKSFNQLILEYQNRLLNKHQINSLFDKLRTYSEHESPVKELETRIEFDRLVKAMHISHSTRLKQSCLPSHQELMQYNQLRIMELVFAIHSTRDGITFIRNYQNKSTFQKLVAEEFPSEFPSSSEFDLEQKPSESNLSNHRSLLFQPETLNKYVHQASGLMHSSLSYATQSFKNGFFELNDDSDPTNKKTSYANYFCM